MIKNSILIIDDDPSVLRTVRTALEGVYEVFAVNSGAAAISFFEKKTVDLILLDVLMPEMNGYEILTKLKDDPKTAPIPVILLTGENTSHTEVKGLELGAVNFISKPFRGKLLLNTIAEHIAFSNAGNGESHHLKDKGEGRKSLTIRQLIFFRALTDILTMFVACAAVCIVEFSIAGTGYIRSTVVSCILFSSILFMFLYLFGEYAKISVDIMERTVCIILSTVFAAAAIFIISVIWGIFHYRFYLTLIFIVGIFLLVENYVECYFLSNGINGRRGTMLIISWNDSEYKKLVRLKRGMLSAFDCSYLILDEDKVEQMKDYLVTEFKRFDYICLYFKPEPVCYHTIAEATKLANRELFILPTSYYVKFFSMKTTILHDSLIFQMSDNKISIVSVAIKRFMDIIFGVVGAVIAFIPMILITLLIKLSSPGPVFYKQVRLTRDKKEFEIYKFRTMVPDAEKLTGPIFAQKDDPRITPIGKILRSTRMDELPQIINILKGDMSIVGPRPERPEFVEKFHEVPDYDDRFAVKAGLTSLSHVLGRYSTFIEERTCYDLFYIHNYSLWMDIKIILLTIKTVCLKSASEGVDES